MSTKIPSDISVFSEKIRIFCIERVRNYIIGILNEDATIFFSIFNDLHPNNQILVLGKDLQKELVTFNKTFESLVYYDSLKSDVESVLELRHASMKLNNLAFERIVSEIKNYLSNNEYVVEFACQTLARASISEEFKKELLLLSQANTLNAHLLKIHDESVKPNEKV